MTKDTKLPPTEKVKIEIRGEEKTSHSNKQDRSELSFKMPHVDTAVLKNGVLLIGAPIVSMLASLYLLGLVMSFILYPIRFFALILSLISSLLKFIF